MLTSYPSTTLWGLASGSASPCADCHGAGILGFSVSKVFTLIRAYSFRHPHFPTLHHSFPRWLHFLLERSPIPHTLVLLTSFGWQFYHYHSQLDQDILTRLY